MLQEPDKTLHLIAGYIKAQADVKVQFDFEQIFNYIDKNKCREEKPFNCLGLDLYLKDLSDMYHRINHVWPQSELKLLKKTAFERMNNIYISERLGLAGEMVSIPRVRLNRSKKSGANNPLAFLPLTFAIKISLINVIYAQR